MQPKLRRDFPDHATRTDARLAIASAALGRCAVHVAIGVEGDIAARIAAICSSREIVQRGVGVAAAVGSQFEDGPEVKEAIQVRGSVDIAVTVEGEIGSRSWIESRRSARQNHRSC